jgi:hypothetical protein
MRQRSLVLAVAFGIASVAVAGARADEWSAMTHIHQVEVTDPYAVMRLHLASDAPPPPNPAACAVSGDSIDVPFAEGNGSIESIYLALLNQHDVRLLVDADTCSERDGRVLDGIRVLPSRHQTEWPNGDWN